MLLIVHVRSGLGARCSIRNLVVISNYPSVATSSCGCSSGTLLISACVTTDREISDSDNGQDGE